MERHLTGRDFFVGDRATVADIALYAYTHVADEGGFEIARFEAIAAWLERVRALPGYVPIHSAALGSSRPTQSRVLRIRFGRPLARRRSGGKLPLATGRDRGPTKARWGGGSLRRRDRASEREGYAQRQATSVPLVAFFVGFCARGRASHPRPKMPHLNTL